MSTFALFSYVKLGYLRWGHTCSDKIYDNCLPNMRHN